ncbi:HDOD domain-containing protein [Vibrio tetraodonis]|uniref:HDOD domain-containing protein n=1 Tax=Vibrio tetraodonis TaxID=2231647 RepID=UPI000E0C5EC7|nr:HDOD domain-containing protein [Vibrio tetraodonis]
MKILLVDDEEMILRGLKRALFANKWSIFIATSGQEALQILESQAIDIVISDILMPKMNGAQLLEKVSKKYPSVIRASLSGYSDGDLTIRGGFFSHLAFTKPCDPKTLEREINRISMLLEVFPDNIIQNAISSINSLPTYPANFYQMKRILECDQPSLDDLADTLIQDPALSAKIIQISNNAMFHCGKDTVCLKEAVTRLGIQAISNILDMMEAHSISNNSPSAQLQELQANSYKVASLAAKMVPDDEKDFTYLAGLLHRIGEYVRLKITPDLMRALLDPKTKGRDKSHIETHIFKTDSYQLAVYLLSYWGFPQKMLDAISLQNTPQQLFDLPFGAASAIYFARSIINNQPIDNQLVTHLGLETKLEAWLQEAI